MMDKRLRRLSFLTLLMLAVPVPPPAWAQREARSQGVRVPGLIDVAPGARREVVSAPSTVAVGESFQVTVTTTGGGCESPGDAGVVLGESEAAIIVSDFTVATSPNMACTMIFKRMTHTATLRFTKPGEAVIRIWGRRVGSDTPHFGVPAVIEQRIMVK